VGNLPHVEKRIDTKGRKQPATKVTKSADVAAVDALADVAHDITRAVNPADHVGTKSESESKSGSKSAASKPQPDASTLALREFEFACRTYLPKLNTSDREEADSFFHRLLAQTTPADKLLH
jgi:hypothetical protein